jgi:uncharacterized protein (TIGR03086 family)
MDLFEQRALAEAEFARRLSLVGEADWSRQTPCTEWNVRALVNHVLGGPRRTILRLSGASVEEVNATRNRDQVGDDTLRTFRTAAREEAAAFRVPGAFSRVVHHQAGDCSGEELLKRRVVDLAVHAWDLAQAIGADDHLDADLVAALWQRLSVEGSGFDLATGYFAPPPGRLSPGASLQEQLLDLLGRSASWRERAS